ncbi:RNA polymerase II transcription factor SIII subunit A-domain-containing protein [Scheffersomyces amazonensis]|uniref:RNA polymerase II transcription factor SIII subunit A-domain-containing protein n=1 Tax=Scheffersomyces amazonensis TaxID=1078765 RepID=UPI00315CCE53
MDGNEIPVRRKVPSLVMISTRVIAANINNLIDIGSTPYHLLESILCKMNAKQLNNIEIISPHIAVHSDKLWRGLIEKDFPTRPSELDPILSRESMPYKALYEKYTKERQLFERDSTARLRRITKKIELQKKENKVTPVKELLKDPTIKRRPYNFGGSSRQTVLPTRNTILNKVRKNLQHRTLIFKKEHLKPYSAYDSFKDKPIQPPRRSFTNIQTSPSRGIYSQPIPTPVTKPSITPTTVIESPNPVPSSSIRSTTPPPLKKRRSETSVFLLPRQRPNVQSAVIKPKPKAKPKDIDEPSSSKIKAVKSSIFSR